MSTFDASAYMVQSIGDRLEGLAADIAHYSEALWHAGERDRARQLDVAARAVAAAFEQLQQG